VCVRVCTADDCRLPKRFERSDLSENISLLATNSINSSQISLGQQSLESARREVVLLPSSRLEDCLQMLYDLGSLPKKQILHQEELEAKDQCKATEAIAEARRNKKLEEEEENARLQAVLAAGLERKNKKESEEARLEEAKQLRLQLESQSRSRQRKIEAHAQARRIKALQVSQAAARKARQERDAQMSQIEASYSAQQKTGKVNEGTFQGSEQAVSSSVMTVRPITTNKKPQTKYAASPFFFSPLLATNMGATNMGATNTGATNTGATNTGATNMGARLQQQTVCPNSPPPVNFGTYKGSEQLLPNSSEASSSPFFSSPLLTSSMGPGAPTVSTNVGAIGAGSHVGRASEDKHLEQINKVLNYAPATAQVVATGFTPSPPKVCMGVCICTYIHSYIHACIRKYTYA
jgi:hypothetical protein